MTGKVIRAVVCCIVIALPVVTGAQDTGYITLYNNGQYDRALEQVNRRLKEIYAKRVDDKRVPTGFITARKISDNTDYKTLLKMFNNRKAGGFFIEDNSELAGLHFYAARCYAKKGDRNAALNHYVQSLRFKRTELKKDDVIYYEIAGVLKKENRFTGYVRALETAYELNPDRYEYSLELGTALYRTRSKKKAVYHLERYINNSGGEIDAKVLLMAGNLYEDLGKYLNTQKYYIEYLKKKKDDAHIHFALGHLAYKRTGNFELAGQSLKTALSLLKEDEIFKRSRAYEYLGDMAYHSLEFGDAIKLYTETIAYQDRVSGEIKKLKEQLKVVTGEINTVKSRLLSDPQYDDYTRHEQLLDSRGKLEFDLERLENEYRKLNPGYAQWQIAQCHERREEYEQAIGFYRKSVFYDFKSSLARSRIIKLQLKIKRGY